MLLITYIYIHANATILHHEIIIYHASIHINITMSFSKKHIWWKMLMLVIMFYFQIYLFCDL
jgi:hypothetical protein